MRSSSLNTVALWTVAVLSPPTLALQPPTAATHVTPAEIVDAYSRGESLPVTAAGHAPLGCLRETVRVAWSLDAKAMRGVEGECFEHDRAGADEAGDMFRLMAETAFANADYLGASSAVRRWSGLSAADASARVDGDAIDLAHLAAQLAEAPAMRRTDDGALFRVPTLRDRAGLRSAEVTVNDIARSMVIDSGANLSVVTESTAEALGLHATGTARIGSSTGESTSTRWAMAPTFRLGDATFEHVVFLVIPDEQLAVPLPGGYQIDGIVGFPVLRALGAVCFDSSSMSTRTSLEPGQGAELRAAGRNMNVVATVAGHPVSLFVDSGADRSRMSDIFALRYPEVIESAAVRSIGRSGAAGIAVHKAAVLENVPVRIGDASISLKALPVELPSSTSPPAAHTGVAGLDLLQALGAYTMDFRTMQLHLDNRCEPLPSGEPRRVEPARTAVDTNPGMSR